MNEEGRIGIREWGIGISGEGRRWTENNDWGVGEEATLHAL